MHFTVAIDKSTTIPSVKLIDTHHNCTATIYAFGALLNSFCIDRNGESFNIIDGFASVEDAELNITEGFKSAKLSPFTCRMKNGGYSLNNLAYKIEKFYLQQHAIHGLLYNAVYEIVNTHADGQSASVGLRLRYEGEDAGYPFPFEVLVNWKLQANHKLSVTSTIFHHNKHAIPMADGWHPYFKLSESIDDCTLQFDSNTQIEFDETLIPTGTKLFDERFVQPALLKGVFLDNCFELKKPGISTCVLKSKALQLTIQPSVAYPFLQVYTPPHRKSIAIENLSGIPDCFNNKIGLVMLEPEKQISFTAAYSIAIL